MSKQQQPQRKFEGVVVATKMTKTAIVRIDRQVIHPKYGKRYTVSRRYKCHNLLSELKLGDKVLFIECRPLSKDKRWRVVKKIS